LQGHDPLNLALRDVHKSQRILVDVLWRGERELPQVIQRRERFWQALKMLFIKWTLAASQFQRLVQLLKLPSLKVSAAYFFWFSCFNGKVQTPTTDFADFH
jgi:hypothetical protein